MARIRTIKPQFWTSPDVADLSVYARMLFIALWCEADREGRMEWRPRAFKIQYFPMDPGFDYVTHCKELTDRGLVLLYGDRDEFAFIPTFHKHQRPHAREAQSRLPAPDLCEPSENKAVQLHRLGSEGASPRQCNARQEGEEEEEKEKEGREEGREAPVETMQNCAARGLPRTGQSLAILFNDRKKGRRKSLSELTAHGEEIDEILRVGLTTFEALETEILRPPRDRSEHWWQLKKRLEEAKREQGNPAGRSVGAARPGITPAMHDEIERRKREGQTGAPAEAGSSP